MRILYHHRTLADGAEGIHIAEMVDAFTALGHEVRVTGAAIRQDHGAGVRHQLRRCLPAPVAEVASLGYNVAEGAHLRQAIRDFRPDLMYVRHARFDVAPLAVARRRRIPTVLEVNAVYSARPYCDFEPLMLSGVARRFERQAFTDATLVAAVSSPLARQVAALADTASVLVVPNGVDARHFDADESEPAAVRERFGFGSAIVIGWAGVLREWHGLELLVRALEIVPDARLLVVGDGPARPALERIASEAGVERRVAITGRVPHQHMRDYIAAMDMAVVSAERTGVASPMKLLEYMAMGRAVVAPRLDNIQELVRDGETGVLFQDGDPADLGCALRTLAQDAAMRVRLGREARRWVTAERSWRRNAELVLAAVSDGARAREVRA